MCVVLIPAIISELIELGIISLIKMSRIVKMLEINKYKKNLICRQENTKDYWRSTLEASTLKAMGAL